MIITDIKLWIHLFFLKSQHLVCNIRCKIHASIFVHLVSPLREHLTAHNIQGPCYVLETSSEGSHFCPPCCWSKSWPIGSMVLVHIGIFTYKQFGWILFGPMLINIPAPWSTWVIDSWPMDFWNLGHGHLRNLNWRSLPYKAYERPVVLYPDKLLLLNWLFPCSSAMILVG